METPTSTPEPDAKVGLVQSLLNFLGGGKTTDAPAEVVQTQPQTDVTNGVVQNQPQQTQPVQNQAPQPQVQQPQPQVQTQPAPQPQQTPTPAPTDALSQLLANATEEQKAELALLLQKAATQPAAEVVTVTQEVKAPAVTSPVNGQAVQPVPLGTQAAPITQDRVYDVGKLRDGGKISREDYGVFRGALMQQQSESIQKELRG